MELWDAYDRQGIMTGIGLIQGEEIGAGASPEEQEEAFGDGNSPAEGLEQEKK